LGHFSWVTFGNGNRLRPCLLAKTVGQWWGNGYRKTAENDGDCCKIAAFAFKK
jgi:hypothetical protein